MQSHSISRRSAIKSTAAILGGTGLGLGAYTLAGSEPAAAAEVTIASISVPDFSLQDDDGEFASLWVRVTGSWAFSSKTDTEPTGVRLDLAVSPPESNGAMNYDRIDRVEQPTSGFDNNDAYELLGEVTSHGSLPPSTFAAPDPEQVTQTTVHVRVTFAVLDGTAVMGEAVAEDTAVVTVENGQVALEVGVDGQGEFSVVQNSTDPTPTYSG